MSFSGGWGLLSIHADLQLLEREAGVFSRALGLYRLDVSLHQLVDQVLPHLSPTHRVGVTDQEHDSHTADHSHDALRDRTSS